MKRRTVPLILSVALASVAMAGSLWLAARARRGPASEFDRRAGEYAQELSGRPLATLSREQRLLLFHSYVILDRQRDALEVWGTLSGELADLPPERRVVFEDMAAGLRRGGRAR